MTKKLKRSSDDSSDSAFKIFDEIHNEDSNMIDKEVKCLEAVIRNSTKLKAAKGKDIQFNDITDAKFLIARYIDIFNPNNNSLSSLDPPNTIKKNKTIYKKPRYLIDLRVKELSPYKSSTWNNRNTKNVISMKQINEDSFTFSRNPTLSQSISPYSKSPLIQFYSYKRSSQNKTIHKYIKELNNIIHSDKIYNPKNNNKEFSIDVKRRLMEYKLERMRQRREVLNSIDTEEVRMIRPLYDYKMKSFKNYDKDSIEFKDKLDLLLIKSQKILARRGKGLTTKQKLRDRLFNKK